MKVDYHNTDIHDKILWLVYGHNCFPQIVCCKVKPGHLGKPSIWGFSIYRRSPGFRTLGRDIALWIDELKEKYGYSMFEFYDNQEEALDRLRKLTTPGKLK
jgi:hypothetical protein